MTIAPDRPPSLASREITLLAALLTVDVTDPSWMRRAECIGVDVNLFYPEQKISARHAKRYCQDCPVALECLAHAFSWGEQGVWGGMTDDDRRDFRRRVNSSAL